MKNKMIFIFSVLTGLLLFSNYSYANSSNLTLPSLDQTDVLALNETAVVLVDHDHNKADILNLKTNQITTLSADINPILDLKVLSNPQKIVLLKKVSNTTISKTVFSYNGNALTTTRIPVTSTNIADKIKWVAPTGTVNERIMLQANNSFSLYQYPWINPSVSYNAEIVDRGYESVSVQDWDFEGYPNLAIEYRASGMMSDDYFVRTVNLYTKQTALFKDFNTDVQLKYNRGNLALYTSYPYQAVPSNVNRPTAVDLQLFFRLINNVSGLRTTAVAGIFQEKAGIPSGWQTEFINSQVFSGDLLEHTWVLYSQSGDPILNKQVWPKEGRSKFLSYSTRSQTAYFLEYVAGKASVIPYSVTK